MVRFNCIPKKEPAVGIYMPTIRVHCGLTQELERDFKLAVKEMGGSVNVSGLFLSEGGGHVYK